LPAKNSVPAVIREHHRQPARLPTFLASASFLQQVAVITTSLL
jgi:hypothetical protein